MGRRKMEKKWTAEKRRNQQAARDKARAELALKQEVSRCHEEAVKENNSRDWLEKHRPIRFRTFETEYGFTSKQAIDSRRQIREKEERDRQKAILFKKWPEYKFYRKK